MAKKKQNKLESKSPYVWAVARIALGFTFFWAFIDKLFGLGFATCRDAQTDTVAVMCEKAWLQGGSPTAGFLKFGTHGPLAPFYQSLAGNTIVDILFMAGLGLIGFALISGIGMKIATLSGALMMLMMYSAMILPENNPVVDEHIIYAIVLIGLLTVNSSQKWGLRNWWVKQSIVKKFPVLE